MSRIPVISLVCNFSSLSLSCVSLYTCNFPNLVCGVDDEALQIDYVTSIFLGQQVLGLSLDWSNRVHTRYCYMFVMFKFLYLSVYCFLYWDIYILVYILLSRYKNIYTSNLGHKQLFSNDNFLSQYMW
jgi:hypothetical protein